MITSNICDPDCFLVVCPPGRDLLLGAKYLFVAAIRVRSAMPMGWLGPPPGPRWVLQHEKAAHGIQAAFSNRYAHSISLRGGVVLFGEWIHLRALAAKAIRPADRIDPSQERHLPSGDRVRSVRGLSQIHFRAAGLPTSLRGSRRYKKTAEPEGPAGIVSCCAVVAALGTVGPSPKRRACGAH
jgi:hypothetical protein